MSAGATLTSRYVVGIDLGTTNSALAYVDTTEGGGRGGDGGADAPTSGGRGGRSAPAEYRGPFPIRLLDIPQIVKEGAIEARGLLPSFLYLPLEEETRAGSFALPWDGAAEAGVSGAYARRRAPELPDRVVTSAKSWLCHAAVDRRAAILPFSAEGGDGPRVSPLAASAAYLSHLRDAFDHVVAEGRKADRLSNQDVYLTVPASFDAAARELTVEAATLAGLSHVVLLEEPQAALHAWVESSGEAWRERVRVGDLLLVVDVGGGTTDLSLVSVGERDGELSLERVAVGDHLLLGGDNMDLALAFSLRERLAAQGTRLDSFQLRGLVSGCRDAKEALLSASPPKSVPLAILGRGRKLVGGTLKVDVSRAEAEPLLLDGFFPEVAFGERPAAGASGLSELGLPYAADAAITRHLAAFLATHAERPVTAVLYNGGVMKAEAARRRVTEVLARWAEDSGGAGPRVLAGIDEETAVARGAASYGLARRGRGVRIRGGTARSYYVGVASSMPAVPGRPQPVRALCVAPFGMEEGTRLDVPRAEFGLLTGETASFRFFASTTRRDDAAGAALDEWETAELPELAPLSVTLPAVPDAVLRPAGPGVGASGAAAGSGGARVPVRLAAHLTEVGTLELWFAAREGAQRWRLELTVREKKGEA